MRHRPEIDGAADRADLSDGFDGNAERDGGGGLEHFVILLLARVAEDL